ncbi:MAG: hypothetical protein ACXWUX_13170 [Allosphingosinicella sp.]
MKLTSLLSIALLAAGTATACSAEPQSTIHSPTGVQEPVMTQPTRDDGVAELPYARGRTFASLDEYLAYLQQTNGTIDLPYWRATGRGVYQWTVRMPGEPAGRETATREELMQRYGFSR